jgi:hypothetical protein
MSLLAKTANSFVKTCAGAITLGVALAPSSALAVTTWNWSFTTDIADQYGSGTFTTADVVPTAGTTYEITGVSGTYNREGTAYTITGLDTSSRNEFQWDGTTSSPILIDLTSWNPYTIPTFYLSGGSKMYFFQDQSGFLPLAVVGADGFGGTTDGNVTSSSLAPNSPPPTAVPGPLPLLGAAAAFQASRRLRRRLNGSLPTS